MSWVVKKTKKQLPKNISAILCNTPWTSFLNKQILCKTINIYYIRRTLLCPRGKQLKRIPFHCQDTLNNFEGATQQPPLLLATAHRSKSSVLQKHGEPSTNKERIDTFSLRPFVLSLCNCASVNGFLLFLSPRLKIPQNTSVTAQLESQPWTTPVSQFSYLPSNLPGGMEFAQTFLLLIGAWLACRVSTAQTHVLPFFLLSAPPPLLFFKGT